MPWVFAIVAVVLFGGLGAVGGFVLYQRSKAAETRTRYIAVMAEAEAARLRAERDDAPDAWTEVAGVAKRATEFAQDSEERQRVEDLVALTTQRGLWSQAKRAETEGRLEEALDFANRAAAARHEPPELASYHHALEAKIADAKRRKERKGRFDAALAAAKAPNEDDDVLKLWSDAAELADDPKDAAEAYNGRGKAHQAAGAELDDPLVEYKLAVKDFSVAIQRAPELPDGYANRALVQKAIGQYQEEQGGEALENYRAAIEDQSKVVEIRGDAAAYTERAQLHQLKAGAERIKGRDAADSVAKAIEDLGTAMGKSPEAAEPVIARGLLYQSEKKYDEALADFERASRLDPTMADIHVYRAQIYWAFADRDVADGRDCVKNLDAAIRAAEKSIEVSPDLPIYHGNRAMMYARRGRVLDAKGADSISSWEAAASSYGEVIRLSPSAAVYIERAGAYWSLGLAETARRKNPVRTYERAIADYDAAIRLNPRDAAAYESRSEVYELKAAQEADPFYSWSGAAGGWRLALSIEPKNPDFASRLAGALEKMADVQLTKGADPLPAWSDALVQLAKLPGDALMSRRRGELSRKIARHELSKGKDPSASFDRAVKEFAAAIRSGDTSAAVYERRASSWKGFGDAQWVARKDPTASFNFAIADYAEAIRRAPKELSYVLSRAGCYESRGDYEEAAGKSPAAWTWNR